MPYIKFPITVITNAGKYAFLYRVLEALRLKHNEMGQKYKNLEITSIEWCYFLNNWYQPREEILIQTILEYRKIIKNNDPLSINLEEVIIF